MLLGAPPPLLSDGDRVSRFGISFSLQVHRDLGEAWDSSYREGIDLAAEANRFGFELHLGQRASRRWPNLSGERVEIGLGQDYRPAEFELSGSDRAVLMGGTSQKVYAGAPLASWGGEAHTISVRLRHAARSPTWRLMQVLCWPGMPSDRTLTANRFHGPEA